MPERNTEQSEPTLDDLQAQVTHAQESLLTEVQAHPSTWFDARTLRDQARNGSDAGVMMFALTDLVNQGKLDLGADLRVRLHAE